MLRSFIIAGVAGFICILLFSLIGVHAYLTSLETNGNTPFAVASSLGIMTLFVVTVIMMSSAGSTLDSTFNSFAKLGVEDTKSIYPSFLENKSPVKVGIWIMVVLAILGNIPMFAGTDILKATTISGTMVMGLAPIFILYKYVGYSPLSFHLSFWTGITLGILYSIGQIPSALAFGDGKYGLLLATNAYGLIICTIAFLIPTCLKQLKSTG
jgi:hypothetical protein